MGDKPPLEDDEVLLRRYNPDDENHFSIDEKTQAKRFRSGGLTFDPYPEDGVTGCSVYRDAVLTEGGLSRDAVLEVVSWRLVSAVAHTVRAVEHGGQRPSDAVADPFPDDSTAPVDVAHGLITLPAELSRSARDKIAKRLAREVFEPANL